MSFGKIEHPRPLANQLVSFLDDLSKRVDCRVDDFRGIGLYVLFQDGDVFYLLTSKDGQARIRQGGTFESLTNRALPGVVELTVESAGTQTELFSQGLRDFIALYRIQAPEPGQVSLELALGGSGSDMEAVSEVIDQPGTSVSADESATFPTNSISQKVMFLRVDGVQRARANLAAAAPRRARGRGRTGVFAVVSTLFFVTLGAIWIGGRLLDENTPASETPAASSQTPDGPATAGTADHEVESGSGPGIADVDPVEAPADSLPVRFSLAWDKSYNQPVTSSPLLEDEKVVFGCRDGRLYALDRNSGEVVWRYGAGGGIGASPVYVSGRFIAADYQGNVFAVGSNDGKALWNIKLPQKVISSPTVSNGEVVVGCLDGYAYALSVETGRTLWKLKTAGRIRASTAHGDGQFYVASYDNKLYAVSEGTGAVRWTYHLGGSLSSSPAADENRVVVGSVGGGIYSIDSKSGKLGWRFDTGAAVKSSIRLDNGRVYAGGNDGFVYCLNAENGVLKWKYHTGDVVLSRPVVRNNLVIVASYDKNVYCLSAETGEELDRFRSTGSIFSSPAIDDQKIYFGNNNGKFYCLNYRQKRTS